MTEMKMSARISGSGLLLVARPTRATRGLDGAIVRPVRPARAHTDSRRDATAVERYYAGPRAFSLSPSRRRSGQASFRVDR